MLDSIYHMTLKLLKTSFTQLYNVNHYITLLNLYTTNGLSILLFVLFDSLRPINNLSVKQGRVLG